MAVDYCGFDLWIVNFDWREIEMKKFFEPEDFKTHYTNTNDSLELMAEIANKKINELIESWPKVYGYGETPTASSLWNMNGPERERAPHTHTARLAFIEEIPKDCKHEPEEVSIQIEDTMDEVTFSYPPTAKCKHCGVELQSTWSEKK